MRLFDLSEKQAETAINALNPDAQTAVW